MTTKFPSHGELAMRVLLFVLIALLASPASADNLFDEWRNKTHGGNRSLVCENVFLAWFREYSEARTFYFGRQWPHYIFGSQMQEFPSQPGLLFGDGELQAGILERRVTNYFIQEALLAAVLRDDVMQRFFGTTYADMPARRLFALVSEVKYYCPSMPWSKLYISLSERPALIGLLKHLGDKARRRNAGLLYAALALHLHHHHDGWLARRPNLRDMSADELLDLQLRLGQIRRTPLGRVYLSVIGSSARQSWLSRARRLEFEIDGQLAARGVNATSNSRVSVIESPREMLERELGLVGEEIDLEALVERLSTPDTPFTLFAQ
jgi:hypothetical protein